MTAPDPETVDHHDWPVTYQELRRIYEHRLTEVRDQQSRVGSILIANGLVLTFAAVRPTPSGNLGVLHAEALAVLAAAILFGLLALWPGIQLRTPPFLDPAKVFEFPDPSVAARRLATDLKRELEAAEHVKVMNRRRYLIRFQLVCISAAVVLLVVIAFASLR